MEEDFSRDNTATLASLQYHHRTQHCWFLQRTWLFTFDINFRRLDGQCIGSLMNDYFMAYCTAQECVILYVILVQRIRV